VSSHLIRIQLVLVATAMKQRRMPYFNKNFALVPLPCITLHCPVDTGTKYLRSSLPTLSLIQHQQPSSNLVASRIAQALRFLTFQWKPSVFHRLFFHVSHDTGISFAHSHRLQDQSRACMGKTVSIFRKVLQPEYCSFTGPAAGQVLIEPATTDSLRK
jgi:hypothetical protein